MRIGLFTDTYYPRVNGVANSVYMLKENLEAQGHRVYVFTTTDPQAPQFEQNVFRIPSIPCKTQRLGTFIRPQLYRLAQNLALDVIHTHTEYTLGIFGRSIARKLGIPLIHTMHTVYEYYTRYLIKSGRFNFATKAIMRRFTAAFCNSASIVIAPTRKIEDLLLSYGVEREIAVIPSGIPLERFAGEQCDPVRVAAIRQELGIAAEDKLLVSIGRVAEEKNLDVILHAMRSYLPQHPDVKLVIVGEGTAKAGLEELSAELRIRSQVIFTGVRPWDEINLYYRLGDVFVSASQSETQGLTYVEAMASGLPVVAREDRCLDGVLLNGRNGYSFRTAPELLDSLDSLLFDSGKLGQFSQEAVKTAQRFSAEAYASNAADLYADLLAKQYARTRFRVS